MLMLASDGETVWISIVLFGALWLVGSYIAKIVKTVARERTRREIAAYIAEGSMTPEQGERLMKAGKSADEA